MATLAYYRTRVPAHAAVDNAVVEAELASAIRRLDASAWGDSYSDGVVWLAAHNVETLPGVGSTTGVRAVTMQRDGDLQVQYAGAGQVGDPLERTAYGIRFLDLRRELAAGAPFFAGVC